MGEGGGDARWKNIYIYIYGGSAREFLCQVCEHGPRGAHVLEFRARDTLMYRIGGGGGGRVRVKNFTVV